MKYVKIKAKKILDPTYKVKYAIESSASKKRLFKPKEAEDKAKVLKKRYPDWNYAVVHNDSSCQGLSYIQIFDEDGSYSRDY